MRLIHTAVTLSFLATMTLITPVRAQQQTADGPTSTKSTPAANAQGASTQNVGQSVDAQALGALRAAANRDDPEAEQTLGEMYRDGRGVPQNASLAAAYLSKAKSDLAKAHGKEGIEKFKAAADQGDIQAERALADIYRNGPVDVRNPLLAAAYTAQANAGGDKRAFYAGEDAWYCKNAMYPPPSCPPPVERTPPAASPSSDDVPLAPSMSETITGVLANGMQQYAAVKGLQAQASAEQQQEIDAAAKAQQALVAQQRAAQAQRELQVEQQNAAFNQEMRAKDLAYRAQQTQLAQQQAQQQAYNASASSPSSSYAQSASLNITTGAVCSAGVPGNISATDRTCQSGACYPGPDGDSNWYCTARSSNCAWPGTAGSMYGSTSPDRTLKCINTGPGGRAHFAAMLGGGGSNQAGGQQSASNVAFTHTPGNLTSDPSTWIGTYTVSITNTGHIGLSCSVTVHGFYDPAPGESHLLTSNTNQPFSQEDDHYVSVGSTQVFTFSGRGFNQVASYTPLCRAQ